MLFPTRSLTRACSLAAAALLVALSQSPNQHLRAQCGPNPIVCENLNPGTPDSEWDISGAGDSTIQGFATSISVNKGETVRFKVNTPASTFNIDIYRLGYYGGQGARKMVTFTGVHGIQQPNCLTNGSTGLIDCGNWTETATWSVPSTAVSGVYVAKLTRVDTGGDSHIVFVVRDDQAQADVLFQTSDTTWQAYNTWGGNSLYVGNPAGRAYKVSYNRPITTRDTSAEDWVFNAEYPAIRYLEANGFNVSYSTGVDTDRTGATELRKHKIFLSVGHDEYWSGPQRANVEAARAAGVNLAFWSGNEVFWKTRWETSIDGTNTPYRTLVTYKETHANAVIDPLDPPTWTGTWRDPRFSPPADGGRPENALTGTIFTVNSAPASTAIRVTGAFASQPFWRNTRVASLAPSGSTTLTQGTLGYEWDENLNNGSRPAGLTTLSTTTVSGVQRLQDNGSTYASGTATHSLTLYRHSSGAWVFGAGTVQWSWGLDSNHDRGNAPADLAMQQAVVNLFSDMGVAPGSLQPGLVPGAPDTQAPTSSISSPAQGASLPSGTPVTIAGTASDTGGAVTKVEVSTNGGTTWSNATGTTSWTFAWTPGAQGATVIRSRATDTSGNVETPSGGITVTVTGPVPDTTPPTAAITSPPGGATVAGTSVTLSATASDNIGVAGVTFKVDGVAIGAEDTTSPYSITWNTVGLADGSHTLTAVARDAANNTGASAGVAVTVVNGAAGPSVDVTAFGDRASAATTVVTSAFSTNAANEVLLAFVGSDQATGTPVTVTGITGGGLTWQLVNRTNVQLGTAEIWRAFAAAKLTNVSVTATLAQSVTSSLTVVSFIGADLSGTNGSGAIGAIGTGNARPGAPSATLVAKRAKSLVFGVGVDYDTATARTVPAGQTMVHSYLAPVGDTYWVQRVNASTSASGATITVNDTAPTGDRYNMSTVEIVSALITDTTFPTVAITMPADNAPVSGIVTVFASADDNIGVVGVQFKLDNVNFGDEVTTGNPYTRSWNTGASTNGPHVLTAVARDGAGNATPSAQVHVTVNNVDTTFPMVSMTAPADNSTVSGTAVTVSAAAADNVGVAGVQFLLDGITPIGPEVATAPYSVTWDTTTTSLGGHTLSARARDGAGNATTSAAINVTVAVVTAPALAIDAFAFGDQPASATSVTTQSFSTTASNELLLAFISADYSSGASTTVTTLAGGGLTWQLVVRTNVQSGTAEIWRAFAAAPLGGVTVTATISQAAASSISILSFVGADATGTNGSGAIGATRSANGASGAPSASIVTTRNNSWVIGVGTDWDAPIGRTLGPNQVMVHQYMPPVGDTYWVQRMVGVTPTAGTTVTINATAPTTDRYNLSVVEVLSK